MEMRSIQNSYNNHVITFVHSDCCRRSGFDEVQEKKGAARAVSLVVWSLFWKQEVPGSIPGSPLFSSFPLIHLIPVLALQSIMNLQQIRERERSRSRSKDNSQQRERALRFEQQQEQFQANQEIIRSLLRIEQNREQPIDKFVKVVWIYKGKYAYDHKANELMSHPKLYLNRLTLAQLEELVPSTFNFERTQKKLGTGYVNYWMGLRVLINAVMGEKKGENVINQAFRAKVAEIINKPYGELVKMQEVIQVTLSNRSGSGDSFWNTVKNKIEERKKEMELEELFAKFKESHKEEEGHKAALEQAEFEEPISPVLGPVSLLGNPRLITTEQQEKSQRQAMAERIFIEQFEKCKEKLEETLSLPKNHNLLSTAIISESTVAYDYITKEIIEFEKYKRMEQDEEQFDDWVPCETEGRFRDRKPQYINRRRVTVEWNKYNSQHYSDDNPPPKTVQGYKFNIFYPDLYDKQKTPQYFLEATESPDYCVIKFKAGPPYKDIAYKIQRREWDFTGKSGFESIFHKGILQLYFNFKKPKFRI